MLAGGGRRRRRRRRRRRGVAPVLALPPIQQQCA